MTARWYMINSFGMATLCLSEANARDVAKDADEMYSRGRPHRAVQLAVEKQPMTPDQIEAAFAEKVGQRSQSQEPDKWDSGFIWFLSGIRAAERSHGIGQNTPKTEGGAA